MPEIHLNNLVLVIVLILKERIGKFMQTGNSDYIKNDFDKVCFQHNMAYGKYKYLTKGTQSDKSVERQSF